MLQDILIIIFFTLVIIPTLAEAFQKILDEDVIFVLTLEVRLLPLCAVLPKWLVHDLVSLSELPLCIVSPLRYALHETGDLLIGLGGLHHLARYASHEDQKTLGDPG